MDDHPNHLGAGQKPAPTTPSPIPEGSVYFEIEAHLIVRVVADTDYLCQEINDATKAMVLLGMPASARPCQGIVLNPLEGLSSYVTTTVQLHFGLQVNKEDAQNLSDHAIGEYIASLLKQMDAQAIKAAPNLRIRHEIPETRDVKITFVARSTEAPEWYEEGLQEREADLIKLANDCAPED